MFTISSTEPLSFLWAVAMSQILPLEEMMTAIEESVAASTLPSERVAPVLLHRVLTTFDLIAIMVGVVLFISNAPIMTGAGPAAYVYWGLGFLTFLIPGALVTGQLGRMFPGEGSIYLWTHKALGPFLGFFAGFCAWFPGVLGLVATGDGALALLEPLVPQALSAPWQQGVAIIVIIAFSAALSVLRFRLTQTIINVVFVCYGSAILLVGVGGFFALLHGHIAPVNYAPHNWLPSPATFTFYGTVILALLGIEVPLNMGVEVKEERAVTHYLIWGSLFVMLAYLIGTFGVMTAVPLADQGSPAAISEAIALGTGGTLGKVLGIVSTLVFLSFFVFTTAVFNYTFARLLFVSGLDQRLPAIVGKVNTNHVPAVAVLVQSTLSSLVTVGIFIVAPLTLRLLSPADLATVIYDVIQAALTVIWCVSMATLFLDVILIRRKYRAHFARLQLAPNWVFTLCIVLGMLASTVGILVTFTNPWTNLLSRGLWNASIGGLAVVALVIGAGIYWLGRDEKSPPGLQSVAPLDSSAEAREAP
jgi:amino acid transporter